jgi:DNA polymerase-3 subunit epsilon
MSIILPFDTETTGIPSAKKALTDPSQPHLVSVSALQVDMAIRRIKQSMSKMVAPAGWEWPDDCPAKVNAHGLTAEDCAAFGDSEKAILDELLHLWFAGDNPATLIAHNLKFDKDIIAIALARYYPGETTLLKAWMDSEGICTMLANKETVDARNAKGGKKLPNLKETYKYFTGEDLEQHHSANADAVAVYQIYMHMMLGN